LAHRHALLNRVRHLHADLLFDVAGHRDGNAFLDGLVHHGGDGDLLGDGPHTGDIAGLPVARAAARAGAVAAGGTASAKSAEGPAEEAAAAGAGAIGAGVAGAGGAVAAAAVAAAGGAATAVAGRGGIAAASRGRLVAEEREGELLLGARIAASVRGAR